MRIYYIFSGIAFFLLFTSCTPQPSQIDNIETYAESRKDDLRLSTYITAHAVDQLLSTIEGRREAISILRANGINKVYVEVYRGGLVVSLDLLKDITDYFTQNGFEVAGGIATVPGNNFGVRQEARYGWFNWQCQEEYDGLVAMVQLAERKNSD